jgi:deazaflavin-dependent oxidoreductase (nitroreductase family)
MTAIQQPDVKTPPRILVRTFWVVHRTLVRMTRGRFGITSPQTGQRFGLMRVTTVGRRSGQRRVAMLGYFEDGPNLVTLAMNGWADADPAWWLNLQAQPETTVDLPDGPRDVRARAATGDERARLWAKFRDYPGWGDDIDALAARRSGQTAVVIFEPRTPADGGRDGRERGAGDATTAPVPGPVARSAAASEIPADAGRRLKPRHLWLVPGLAIAFSANAVAAEHTLGLLPLLLFGIAPHAAVLARIGQPHGRGGIAPRAVPLFNAMHHPVVPLAVMATAAVGILSPFWYVGALAWLSHIVVDWALGDGLREADGSVRRSALALAVERIR